MGQSSKSHPIARQLGDATLCILSADAARMARVTMPDNGRAVDLEHDALANAKRLVIEALHGIERWKVGDDGED